MRSTPCRRSNTAVAAALGMLGVVGVVSTLPGCAAHPSSPPTSSTAPANRIRTDGIYECRGVEIPVSTGGWAVVHLPRTIARWAYFLRFYSNGNGETRFLEAREPITTAEAVRHMEETNRDSDNGKTYLADDNRVHIVFARPFPRDADGVISDGQLILRWNTGPGPQALSAFRFVKCP